MSWTDRRWRVRTVLVGLVFASLLPGLLGAGYFLFREYRNGLADREEENIIVARTMMQSVDAQLAKAKVLAQTLATATALREGSLAGLHARSRELLAVAGIGTNVVVSDASGQQVMNTLREIGEPLPRHGNPQLVQRVFELGETVISDVYTGGVLGRPVLSVDVPVRLQGRIVYDLSVGILPLEFDPLLAAPGLPPEWVVAIFDSSGTIVARNYAPEQFVGQKGTAEFIERIRRTGEGVMETTSREGIEVVSAYSRSPRTGWSVGIGMPRREIQAGLARALGTMAGAFALLFAIGIALAGVAAATIAHSMRALIAPAMALGSGAGASVAPVRIHEADEVGRAIGEASELLAERARALELANAALRAREADLREAHRVARLGGWRWSRERDIEPSEEAREIFGVGSGTFQEMRGTVLAVEDWDRVNAAVREAVQARRGFELQIPVNAANAERKWAEVKCEALLDSRGEVVELVGTVQDTTERKRAQDALRESEAHFREQLAREVAERTAQLTEANHTLERVAREDALTGLNNRMSANERLRFEFVRMKRGGDGYAVLLMDIDRFKRINDTFGHETGDEVLRHFAAILRDALRENDFVARFGGEEFIAILPDTGEAGALRAAEKIRSDIAASHFPVCDSVTVSVGVAMAHPIDAVEEDALRRADAALYRAKGEGRNTVRQAA